MSINPEYATNYVRAYRTEFLLPPGARRVKRRQVDRWLGLSLSLLNGHRGICVQTEGGKRDDTLPQAPDDLAVYLGATAGKTYWFIPAWDTWQ